MTMRCTKPHSVSLAAFAEMVQEVLEHVAAIAIVIVIPYRNAENEGREILEQSRLVQLKEEISLPK